MHSVSLLLSLTMTAAPLAAVTPAKAPAAAAAPVAAPRAATPAPAAAPAAGSAPVAATAPAEPAPAASAPVESAAPPPKLVLDETPEPSPSVSPPPPPLAPAPPPRIDLRTPAPLPPVERNVHSHEGLYLRLALGFTGFSESIVSKLEEGDKPRDEGYQGGFGTASEVAIGGTVGNGFVLGGGLYSANILTSTYTQIRGTPVPDAMQRPASFSILGMMGDWYVRPHSGFHAQAALGLAVLTGLDVSTPRFANRDPAFGGGAMVGAGYEWWVADEWGFGILARATAGIVSEKDDTGERWFHLATASPSILFSATYN